MRKTSGLGRWVWGLVATAAAGVFAGAAEPHPASKLPVRTLHSFSTPLVAFAQDGPRIAWVTQDDSDCFTSVYERTVATGVEAKLTTENGSTCIDAGPAGGLPEPVMALAGTVGLWEIRTASNSEIDVNMESGEPGKDDYGTGGATFNGGAYSGVDQSAMAPVSGDGTTLAYIDNGNWDEGPGLGEVYIVHRPDAKRLGSVQGATALSVDGSRIAVALQTTPGQARSADPAWSSDGKEIAFDSRLRAKPGIFVAKLDGSGFRLLTSDGSDPAWSPDGKSIAFVSDAGVSVVRADGTGAHVIESKRFANQVAWSPDGKELAFTGGLGLAVVGADGKGLKILLPDPPADEDGGRFDTPTWSPDSTKIAFWNRLDSRVHVISADGTGNRVVTLPDAGGQPAWSPDGSELAIGGCKIELAKFDGSSPQVLTNPSWKSGLPCDEHPSWSPDGSTIIFSHVTADNAADLYTVKPDGSDLTKVALPAPTPPQGKIEILTDTGGVTRTIDGPVTRAIGLSGTTLVALVGGKIEVYDTQTGRLVRTIAAVGANPVLSLSGQRVVFCKGQAIYLADTATGKVSTLTVATATPIGLSIQGTRVAWGDNVHKHGRIQAIELPA